MVQPRKALRVNSVCVHSLFVITVIKINNRLSHFQLDIQKTSHIEAEEG